MASLPLTITSEDDLRVVASLLANDRDGCPRVDRQAMAFLREELVAGRDPLGEAFCRLRSPVARRAAGATYTPSCIVSAMLRWAAAQPAAPERIVDPGAGSGRFLLAAALRFPGARLVAIETDPLPVAILRANATVLQVANRLDVLEEDYRSTRLEPVAGPTLFIGNPPYVRHHAIDARWKDWLASSAAKRGLKVSKLAGLHVHFFLKTADLARDGDFGAFVTAAEWLDVNYGRVVREILADGLRGESLHVIDPAALPFDDAATTAAIACFRSGTRGSDLRLRRVATTADLGDLSAGDQVPWETLARQPRWSVLVRGGAPRPAGHLEVGELFHVHRGQVTGHNATWIAGPHSRHLPRGVLFPAITRAKELFAAGEALTDLRALRCVIDLPVGWQDDPALSVADKAAIDVFLAWARQAGAADGYIARHRAAWYSVGLRPPAPILCTYMARRPPSFARNVAGARHINIAHGLYPRQPLPEPTLRAIVAWLRTKVGVEAGRTYAGGLTKFEPGEIARLTVPIGLIEETGHGLEQGQQGTAGLG